MRFNLEAHFTFSGDISSIKKDMEKFISDANEDLMKKYHKEIANIEINGRNLLFFTIKMEFKSRYFLLRILTLGQ